MENKTEFIGFPKMGRLSREVILTEKLDGTNSSIRITDEGEFLVGSRTKFITPGKATDNHGFAAWAYANKEDLMTLGPGLHFGEWWGKGIQRGYGMAEKVFSLFNTYRWDPEYGTEKKPECCRVVPTLWRGIFDTAQIQGILTLLAANGSSAAPGFTNPEGIIIWHTAANIGFKKTILHDEMPKTMVKNEE